MEIGTRVRVSNPYQINYPLEGIIIKKETFGGVKMSLVKFMVCEVWYADEDLEETE